MKKSRNLWLLLVALLVVGPAITASAESDDSNVKTYTLTGQLVLPKSDTKTTVSLTDASGICSSVVKRERVPFPGNWKKMDKTEKNQWYSNWPKSDEGKAFRIRATKAKNAQVHRKITADENGKFKLEKLKPGKYSLSILIKNPKRPNSRDPLYTLHKGITVKEQDTKLGQLTMIKLLQIGDMAPPFTTQTVDGKQLSLSDYRGQYVLIDFWAVWCGPCKGETPNLIDTYKEFGERKDFEIIGLSLDNDAKAPIKYAKEHNTTWVQGFLGSWNEDKVTKMYNIKGIPSMWLIGPDGKIVAKELRGARIKETVAKYLNQKKKNATKS